MLGVRKSVWAVFLALAACAMAWEAAAGVLGPSEHNRLGRQLEHRPAVFFVAKGPADSCGKGCSEWIAAVGSMDNGAAERFKELLGKLNGRKLPVFFHSPGGISGSGMTIGDVLREHRMATGVGQTETRCRVFDKKDKDCQDKIKAGEAIPAKLVTNGAVCASSCVYAFAGGSSRQLASAAILGVHSPKFSIDLTRKIPTIPSNASRKKQLEILQEIRNPKPNPDRVAEYKQIERRYYLRMGVDPDLVDLAFKTPHERMYVLDRGELGRFGLETRNDNFETRWTFSSMPGGQVTVVKSVTRRSASAPTENLTTLLYLYCSSLGAPLVGYRRELTSDPDRAPILMGASFDDWFLEFKSTSTKGGVEIGIFGARPLYEETVARFAEAKTLTIWEHAKGNEQEIRATKLSNAGFQATLTEFRKRCVPASPTNAPTIGLLSQPTVKTIPVKPWPLAPGPGMSVVPVKQAEPVLAPEAIAPDSKQFSKPQAPTVE